MARPNKIKVFKMGENENNNIEAEALALYFSVVFE